MGYEIPETNIGSFNQNDLVKYAKASGDFNPIHLDKEFAKAIGLKIRKRLPNIKEPKTGCDILIDGILGLGASRSPKGQLLSAINFINEVSAKKKVFVISIDLPSGLDPCSGQVLGQSAVRADETIMLLSPKQGCYTDQASKHVGTLVFSDLGITNYHKYGTKTSELIKPDLFSVDKRNLVVAMVGFSISLGTFFSLSFSIKKKKSQKILTMLI